MLRVPAAAPTHPSPCQTILLVVDAGILGRGWVGHADGQVQPPRNKVFDDRHAALQRRRQAQHEQGGTSNLPTPHDNHTANCKYPPPDRFLVESDNVVDLASHRQGQLADKNTDGRGRVGHGDNLHSHTQALMLGTLGGAVGNARSDHSRAGCHSQVLQQLHLHTGLQRLWVGLRGGRRGGGGGEE